MKTLKAEKENSRSRRSGFTLVEVLIASTIMLVVVISVYNMILYTQRTHLTEGRRLDMQQAARAFEQLFNDQVRGAGTILNLMHTPGFLGAQPPFTGLLALNNAAYPDGLIAAAGDPHAVTSLTGDYTPGDASLNVISTDRADDGTPAWAVGDIGLVMRDNGFYVFLVEAVAGTVLTARTEAVYYSGLLNTANYNDPLDEQYGQDGNTNDYPAASPVIRLDYFSIYLAVDNADGSRSLTLTTDCQGIADVLGNPGLQRAVVLVPELEDLQIAWVSRDEPPQFWADADVTRADPCPPGGENQSLCIEFIDMFRNRNLASARVSVLFRTDEEREKRAGSGIVYPKPAMGDRPAATIGPARYHYFYLENEILMRNYDIIY